VGEVYQINYAWQPKTPLDLSVVTNSMSKPSDTDLNAVLNSQFRMAEGATGVGTFERRFAALAFFNQLPPSEIGYENAAAQRTATHGWDLGMWFTQPCIIVIGTVGEGRDSKMPSPVPLMVDGEPVPNGGQTLVRWIYPLPDDPPPFPTSAETPATVPAADPSSDTAPADTGV
jgi:hypothetical protein